MSKRVPKLKFTREELTDPAIEKAAKKANRRIRKLEQAEEKIPKKKVTEQVAKDAQGKKKSSPRIHFEEKKPPSKLKHTVEVAPVDLAIVQFHRQAGKQEQDNVGAESAHRMEETSEVGIRRAAASQRSRKLRPYRKAAQAERKADRANLRVLNTRTERTGGFSSNPYSRWQQKRAIKREYAAAKRAGYDLNQTVSASQITGSAIQRASRRTRQQARFVRRHRKPFLVVIALALLLVFILSAFSSCTILVDSIGASIAGSTYPNEDSDMLAAEAAYCALEDELREYLDTYQETHDYDVYRFDLDEIEHDPYVLISILSALHLGGWTIDEVRDTIQDLFDRQYILTETVVTRHDRTICTVKLENRDLSHIPILIMDEDRLSVYATYMGVLGNRPDLFPDSRYIGLYIDGDYTRYEIPPEALTDEKFAAMIREGEKYLGYPYVWGGSNPATSFDCSGFVSWVINHSGWNVGRQTAQGLCNLCTPVSSANVRPGDLVFFKGTYDTPGVSHVGIYVGNGKMLHCGDPISYANLNTNYWRSHFYQFGRLP